MVTPVSIESVAGLIHGAFSTSAGVTLYPNTYAATDAWACLNIYNRLQELKRTGNFEIEEATVTAEDESQAK